MFNNPGKVVAKFCAKYLHQQVKKNEAYAAGDIGTSVQKAYLRYFSLLDYESELVFISISQIVGCLDCQVDATLLFMSVPLDWKK